MSDLIGKQFDLYQTSALSGFPDLLLVSRCGTAWWRGRTKLMQTRRSCRIGVRNSKPSPTCFFLYRWLVVKSSKQQTFTLDQNQSLTLNPSQVLTLNQIKRDAQGKLEEELSHARTELEEMTQVYIQINTSIYIPKHRKNCECCPGHYLIVSHYSSISWFKFRNLSVIVNCVTNSLNGFQSKSRSLSL